MPINTDTDLDVKLAVYMERLDAYIESQTNLNQSLCDSLTSVRQDIEEIMGWRNRIVGMKSALFAVGLLFLHTSVVMGGLVALFKWFASGDK